MSSPKETETPELVHLKVLEAVWSNLARKQGAEGISLVNDVDGRLPNVPPNFRWVESNYALWGFYTLFTQDLCILRSGCLVINPSRSTNFAATNVLHVVLVILASASWQTTRTLTAHMTV